ncbi:MAG: hypothetical protein AMJ91_07960 [candidate division Zixibacteria bacterium SM23_73_3]|nr:MAG: hypothetical protein AMJ91_07960 [candidate division Zixibacteria bacterium SM23_73_3]
MVFGKPSPKKSLKDLSRTIPLKAHTFDEQENIEEYIVRIWVKVTFEEKKNKKTIWKEDDLLGWGIYSAQDETEDLGKERAIEKLAEDIVNKTVKGW